MDLGTLAKCVEVNDSLMKAVKSADHGALKDMLSDLRVADVRNRLKVRADAHLRI